MSIVLLPLAEITLFALGCVAIHALRRQADAVTATLACLATLLVLMIGIALAPDTVAKYQAVGIGDFIQGSSAVY